MGVENFRIPRFEYECKLGKTVLSPANFSRARYVEASIFFTYNCTDYGAHVLISMYSSVSCMFNISYFYRPHLSQFLTDRKRRLQILLNVVVTKD